MILGYRNQDGRHFPIAKRPKNRAVRSIPDRSRAKKLLIAMLVFCGVLVAVAFLMPGLHEHVPLSPGRAARGRLVTLLAAERTFRAGDYLGTGEHSYWRPDIAGLRSIEVRGRALELIDRPLALADDHPATEASGATQAVALEGYWYRSIPFLGEKSPDPNRFAACAYPESYPASGRLTLIIDDEGTVYARDLGPGGRVDVYPEDPLRQGWKKVE